MSDINKNKTAMYPMVPAEVCPVQSVKVPDLAKGGQRNRRHAVYFAVAVLNDFIEYGDPVLVQGDIPKFLIDGDSLADIKERLFAELEGLFQNAQDVYDGKTTPEQLREQALKEMETKQSEIEVTELGTNS